MDWNVAGQILTIIEAERDRRREALEKEEIWDYARDRWLFEELPFVNELCLTLIVAVWHQLEREIVHLAARATENGQPVNRWMYEENVRRRRKEAKTKGLASMLTHLGMDCPAWMETLRLLANCYKHEPDRRPGEALLAQIELPLKPTEPLVVAYAPLAESRLFLGGLAASLGVEEHYDYCGIASTFISRAEDLLTQAKASSILSDIEWGPVSLSEFEG